MKTFDDIYLKLGKQLLKKGVTQDLSYPVRAKYADGEPAITKAIEGVSFSITPDMGVPILRSKRVPLKTPLVELDWIWREMSNDVNHLNSRGVKIWDEWKITGDSECLGYEGTIGRAYGWQLSHKHISVDIGEGIRKSLNQVEYVLHELKHNPNSRRIMTSLWGVDDLNDMALEPCVWSTHWTVLGGKLNLHVKQRSADFALGVPFNVYQYHVLHAVIAKFTGIELGTMYWNIDNLHIYSRHEENISNQIDLYKLDGKFNKKPTLNIPELNMDDFFANDLSKVTVNDYEYLADYKFEIAE